MAKYFIDFEFIEGFHKPLFGKRRHFIDMISVGIVSEDGRTYYAISNEFNPKDADQWVKDNVIAPICIDKSYSISDLKKHVGKSNNKIASDIASFFGCWQDGPINMAPEGIEVYGYYADYDWVLFCSLFGRMIDLPKGFPMYCRDLKQMFDDKISPSEIRSIGYDAAVERLKKKKGYPVQKDEHNALSDAKWDLELYKFLQTF